MIIYTEEYQNNIVQYWHTFVQSGSPISLEPQQVRSVIYDSWVRSKNHKVNPMEVKSYSLSSSEFTELLRKKEDLLSIAHSYMLNLYLFVKGSNFIVLLTDEQGYILDLIGDDDIIQTRIKTSNLLIGSNRSEEYAGTNAIGTCLVIDKPIQVLGEEHYVKSHHPFTCSGAPIHDEEGRIIGCLNITGPREKIHTHTLGMVVAAVDGIEKGMKMKKAYQKISFANIQLDTTIQSISSGIIMIDGYGVITQFNNHAANMLHLSAEEMKGKKLQDLFSHSDYCEPFHLLSNHIYNKEINFTNQFGKVLSFSITATKITNGSGSPMGSVIVLEEIKQVHKLVNRVSGFTAKYHFHSLIGSSLKMKELKNLGILASKSNSNVLILGESGTGKELVAQAIHNASDRASGPFIAINCGSLPKGLIESELFGYEGGSFTGASKDGQPGKFELADGGTIFLDEIGDMALDIQASLLRVIQDREITRIGGKKSKSINVRIMAATNCNLENKIMNNEFRSDLYYRLNVFSIFTPPLRERKEDIKELCQHFIENGNAFMNKKIIAVSPEALNSLLTYDWPGNIRELENIIERAINLAQTPFIQVYDLPRNLYENTLSTPSLPKGNLPVQSQIGSTKENAMLASIKEMEYDVIVKVLQKTAGNMKRAADILGIGRRTLYRKIEQHQIDISGFR